VIVEIPDAEDGSKLTLMHLMQAARRVITTRVAQLPGSMGSTELWVRLRQAEQNAQALGNKGLWSQALDQFQREYAGLLSAVPSGDAEPIGRAVHAVNGVNGVGSVDTDFFGLLQRAVQSLRTGDPRDAGYMLVRAKDMLHQLSPNVSESGYGAYKAVAETMNRGVPSGARVMRRSNVGGMLTDMILGSAYAGRADTTSFGSPSAGANTGGSGNTFAGGSSGVF
jgi:hypothetical protein